MHETAEICAKIVMVIVVIFNLFYNYQVITKKITPTLSTWIIFMFGTGSSLATYMMSDFHDPQSGILNIMDFASSSVVAIVIFFFGNRALRFKPHEKWYLVTAVAIVAYGLISGNAWQSNLFAQGLISLGYLPTFHSFYSLKRNTESYIGWICALLAGTFGSVPAEDTLTLIYSARTIFLVIFVLSFMIYYDIRAKLIAASN